MTTKEYYWKNKEKIGEYNRKWYEENQEKQREYKRKYSKENREKCRKWQRANRNKCIVISWSTHKKQKEALFKERGKKCEECGATERLHFPHTEYVKRLDVIKILCIPCHVNLHRKLRTYEVPHTSPT